MEIILSTTNKDDYLRIKSTGHLDTKDDLVEHAKILYAEIRKYEHKKIFIDVIDVNRPTYLLSYYNAIEHYINNFPVEVRSLKIAVLIPQEHIEVGKFWETTAVNRGLQYYVFTSRQEAHEWLLR